MGVLGDVESGWFAQVAHGCRWISTNALNFVSCGNHWGDSLYAKMDKAADRYVDSINEQTIRHAIATGATPNAALSAGNAAMDRIADPKTITDLTDLTSHGASIAKRTAMTILSPSQDGVSVLMPLLLAAGIAVGSFLLIANDSPQIPRRSGTMRRGK